MRKVFILKRIETGLNEAGDDQVQGFKLRRLFEQPECALVIVINNSQDLTVNQIRLLERGLRPLFNDPVSVIY